MLFHDGRLEMPNLLLMLAALVASTALGGSAASASSAPVQVDFVKHVVDPGNLVFEGTVSGGVNGSLTSRLVSLNRVSGPNYHITFDWIVSAGEQSFAARTTGIWNTLTGRVGLNGKVISSGYLSGAQVHEEGHLVDPSSLTFAGFLRLLPATAD
jgi:hypothetical protein